MARFGVAVNGLKGFGGLRLRESGRRDLCQGMGCHDPAEGLEHGFGKGRMTTDELFHRTATEHEETTAPEGAVGKLATTVGVEEGVLAEEIATTQGGQALLIAGTLFDRGHPTLDEDEDLALTETLAGHQEVGVDIEDHGLVEQLIEGGIGQGREKLAGLGPAGVGVGF